MLKKLFKPKNFSAVIWLFAALGAVAAMFFKRTSISDEKGRKTNIYKLGNHAAFVTNKKPKSAAADSVKNFFTQNI
ncbi:MAG: hypothetical protein K2J76_07895 [Oscillospiraceae bacterium]|nr:hypothetical protein [Oscillospiraceae bacterium]